MTMAKPPASPPHSDIDGVDEDEVRNVDAAIEADQDTEDLERARRQASGRPDRGEDEDNRDDRSR
jgi:hypothetical protein